MAIKNYRKLASFAVATACAVLVEGPAFSQITLHPGVIPDKVMHNSQARDFAYCEIAPVLGKPPVAQFYNTSGPEDYCPVDKASLGDGRVLGLWSR
jgi:hypothetical protein